MNECGQRMILPTPETYRWQRVMQFVLLLSVVVITLVISGCAEINIRFGNRPDPAALETRLRIGESTSADILRVLGKPYGHGKEMLPVMGKHGVMTPARTQPRDIWAYYYEEATLEDSRRIILYVYLDTDRYDGYMWFSSLPGTVGATVIRPAIKPSVKPDMKVTPEPRERVEKPAKKEQVPDERYPHRLTGNEISAHFRHYKRFTFDRVPKTDFTINIRPKGYVERICPECFMNRGIGIMKIKASQGQVCFDWDQVSYPSSTCFELIQLEKNRYKLVDPVDGETYGYVVQ